MYGNVLPDEVEAYIELIASQEGIKLNHGDFRLINKLLHLSGNNHFGVTLTNIDLAVRMNETPRSVAERLNRLFKLGILLKNTKYYRHNGHPVVVREIRFSSYWIEPLSIVQLNEANDFYKERYAMYEDPQEPTSEEVESQELEVEEKQSSFAKQGNTYVNTTTGETFEI